MHFIIFNVEHGFCALLQADNRNLMLFDCGINLTTGFTPTEYLRKIKCTGIENFIISNFDQDHVSDLPSIIENFSIGVFYRNKTISIDDLRTLKLQSGPLKPAMQSTLKFAHDYRFPVTTYPEFPNIDFNTFFNSYPEFNDTNNLSLVSFIHYDGVGIIYPGDLEKSGWTKLLENESFRNNLKKTKIFIASHHGRENGFCEEVFQYCKPEIIIISDKEIVHETQKNRYAQFASGVKWDTGETRYVLTTRNDENIKIAKTQGSSFTITNKAVL